MTADEAKIILRDALSPKEVGAKVEFLLKLDRMPTPILLFEAQKLINEQNLSKSAKGQVVPPSKNLSGAPRLRRVSS